MRNILLIGCGVMGNAIIAPLEHEFYNVYVYDPYAVSVPQSAIAIKNLSVATDMEVVIFAVKPQVFRSEKFQAELKDLQLADKAVEFVSVMGGVSLSEFSSVIQSAVSLQASQDVHFVRSMPNMAAAVAASCTAVCGSGTHAKFLLSLSGTVMSLPEEQFETFTALSGCLPALLGTFIHQAARYGNSQGIPIGQSKTIVNAMVHGIGRLLVSGIYKSGEDLADDIASAGGITAAGMLQAEQAGFRAGVIGFLDGAKAKGEALLSRKK